MADARLQSWDRDGFFIVRGLFDAARIAELAAICDPVLAEVRANSTATGHTGTHITGLLAPEHYADRQEALERLAALPSSPEVVRLVCDLGLPHQGPLTLRTMQYFHEPSARDYDGEWHRDGDFVSALHGADDRAAAPRAPLLRFRIAFLPDDHLDYVPGSHRRVDTPEELQLRRGAVRNTELSTGSMRIELQPGDACVFDTWGIHRARYRQASRRRTLDLIFGFGTSESTLGSRLLSWIREQRQDTRRQP